MLDKNSYFFRRKIKPDHGARLHADHLSWGNKNKQIWVNHLNTPKVRYVRIDPLVKPCAQDVHRCFCCEPPAVYVFLSADIYICPHLFISFDTVKWGTFSFHHPTTPAWDALYIRVHSYPCRKGFFGFKHITVNDRGSRSRTTIPRFRVRAILDGNNTIEWHGWTEFKDMLCILRVLKPYSEVVLSYMVHIFMQFNSSTNENYSETNSPSY